MLKFETQFADILNEVEFLNQDLRRILFSKKITDKDSYKLNDLYKSRGTKLQELIKLNKENIGKVLSSSLHERIDKFAKEDKVLLDKLNGLRVSMAKDLKKRSQQRKLLIYSKER